MTTEFNIYAKIYNMWIKSFFSFLKNFRKNKEPKPELASINKGNPPPKIIHS